MQHTCINKSATIDQLSITVSQFEKAKLTEILIKTQMSINKPYTLDKNILLMPLYIDYCVKLNA